ncbi:uncharacterized protein ARMOST_10121 [Armillaria ostoyae]|uniref:Uncharacterized protein n=1 Tax=Armillaria ostoyae TaxID=47428 RepID=A0A284RDE3_ARMOS|nr:uncharacterized protein ARMOST_10121 [Armillaria ostoyae]
MHGQFARKTYLSAETLRGHEPPLNTEDMNVKDGSLEQVWINALEHLRELNGAPSVKMHDTPRESI